MKRHEAIVSLSRDHHTALLFCWKLRQGISKEIEPARMQAYVAYFWETHLQPHFLEEEQLIFPACDPELAGKALQDHHSIRDQVKHVSTSGKVDPVELAKLADTVDEHVRFEERTLFPNMQKVLAEDLLLGIGKQLAATHQIHTDDFADPFWV
jgi:iron-sulfur cluster repair protein YtfE (RIC family)